MKRAYDYDDFYDSYYSYYYLYGDLDNLTCNYRYEEEKTTEIGCNNIKPSSASDCKLSRNENMGSLCCYVKDSNYTSPYC